MSRPPAGMRHAAPTSCRGPLSLAFTGDVTALCIASLQTSASDGQAIADGGGDSTGGGTPSGAATLLLAGIGSQLHVYHLPSGQRCCCVAVLPDSARVHGISWVQEPAAAAAAGSQRPALLLAVHGTRHAALLRLVGPPAADADGEWRVEPLVQLPRFQPWTMDVQLSLADSSGTYSSGSGHSSGGCSLLLAVGLSDNSVQAFSIQLPSSKIGSSGSGGSSSGSGISSGSGAARVQPVVHAECSDRCLLYSMALLLQQQDGRQLPENGHQIQHQEPGSGSGGSTSNGSTSSSSGHYLVAAGTIFLDVVVWATPAASAAPLGDQAAATPKASPLLFRLKGHEGSIHRCSSS